MADKAEFCGCTDGFMLAYCDRGGDDVCYEIQKCDECNKFASDKEASLAFGEHYYALLGGTDTVATRVEKT